MKEKGIKTWVEAEIVADKRVDVVLMVSIGSDTAGLRVLSLDNDTTSSKNSDQLELYQPSIDSYLRLLSKRNVEPVDINKAVQDAVECIKASIHHLGYTEGLSVIVPMELKNIKEED
jgi:hypothetical protein